jgi:hypothetical protein
MHTPKVTFVVPCYKLAHLLRECLDSILTQSFHDFEVLIMDDCSPDDTAAVAQSFQDPRVKYVRNEPNLGHLRNYNKGLEMAAGDYIWLISADDRLRTPDVLQRYVETMEANPGVGFAFCPGFGLKDGRETGIVSWATLDSPDAIVNGRRFLYRLLESNCVLAPAGLVRKSCYERVGLFPLDLPFAGDWYLWCALALWYDVAYFAEPMVNYREHGESMTDVLLASDVKRLASDELAVRWRMKALLEQAGEARLAEHCQQSIVDYYVGALSARTCRGTRFRMSLDEFDESLTAQGGDQAVKDGIRREVLARVGRHLFWDRDLDSDVRLYRLAIQHGSWNTRLWLKYTVLRLGPVGTLIMRTVSLLRPATRGPLTSREAS